MRILRLDEVKLTRKEEETYIDIMSNLPKLNDALQDEDLCDLETVRKMIKVELATKQRPATLGRLVGRFKTLASREIDHELRES